MTRIIEHYYGAKTVLSTLNQIKTKTTKKLIIALSISKTTSITGHYSKYSVRSAIIFN